MSPQRVFSAERVIARSPWDVFELLADESQQYRWRDKWAAKHHPVVEADKYTRIVFENGDIYEIEPEGSDTRLSVRRTFFGEGFMGALNIRMRSKKNYQEELQSELKRIDACLVFGEL